MVWNDLPEGWEIRRLGEVTRIGVPKGWKPTPHDGKVLFIEMADIDQETGLHSRYIWKDFDEVSGGKVRFAADAILVAKITPCTENNKTALVPEIPTNGGYATTEVFAVHPSMWTDRLYLLYFLRSPQVREMLVRSMTGSTGRQRVPKQALEDLETPLPPLDEQRRIVARIEELTERIDAARRLRAEAAEEAAAILPTALAEVFGEAETRGWERHRLADVALIGTPKDWKPRPKDGKIPFIEMADIDQETGLNSRYVWADYDKVSKGKVKFQSDAILVAKITPCTENNKTALAPEMPTDGGFATTEVFAVHPTGFTNRLYLLAFLRSPQVRSELVSSMTGSTGRQRVPKQALENLEMPLPPLDEQRRIVEYLDAVQAKVEAIRRHQAETRMEIGAMSGAVLERAFRGEL